MLCENPHSITTGCYRGCSLTSQIVPAFQTPREPESHKHWLRATIGKDKKGKPLKAHRAAIQNCGPEAWASAASNMADRFSE